MKINEEEENAPVALMDISPAENEAPVGPSAEEEAAFLSGDQGSVSRPALAPKIDSIESDAAPLPPMEDLVKRIPAPARELIENLFRARFVTVKRMPKTALKS